MENQENYYKNADFLAKYDPLLASQLEDIDCGSLQFCRTHAGELNLVEVQKEPHVYLHQQAGAAWEARQWAKSLPLEKTDVIIVYGLGLGYYYYPLHDWLKESKQRYLVFIEDDLRVIRRFLESSLSSQVIKNKQVVIFGTPFLRKTTYLWKDLGRDLPKLFWTFCRSEVHIAALQTYFFSRFDFFGTLAAQCYAAMGRARRRLTEFLEPTVNPIFRNFYANMPYVWQAVPASAVFGVLSSMPTILAGAGPSLNKQLSLLQEQTDKALLLAGGSGVNALTHAGMMPHAAAAIDPTSIQASRQMTSFAFEMPVFYQNRYYAEAFLQLHGPRLYVCGSGDFPIGGWFENQLGINNSYEIMRGVSSSNFLLEMAALLGCDPIVLVGTDLAYTENTHYAVGVISHPTDKMPQKETDIQPRLAVPSVSGQEVFTKLEWCLEAICMTDFKDRHPLMTFLNATEGGMPIEGVPNVSFQTTMHQFFNHSQDIQGVLHGAIQNAAAQTLVKEQQVLEALEDWKKSLLRSLGYLKKLKECLQSNKKRFLKKESLPFGPYSGIASLWECELHEEKAYQFLLNVFNAVFNALHMQSFSSIARSNTSKKKLSELFVLEKTRVRFLEKHARYHLRMLTKGLSTYHRQQRALKKINSETITQISPSNIDYEGQKKSLIIDEPALELCVKADFKPECVPDFLLPKSGQESDITAIIGEKAGKAHGQTLYFYPTGRIKIEAYYENGELHGPWSYFTESGNLLVKSWFIHGHRQGKSCYYYYNGQLYGIQTYRHGVAHGRWNYYYQNGMPKTLLHYVDGRLHGVVQLYYPNGHLKKELHFIEGRLQGKERLWAADGKLIFETSHGE